MDRNKNMQGGYQLRSRRAPYSPAPIDTQFGVEGFAAIGNPSRGFYSDHIIQSAKRQDRFFVSVFGQSDTVIYLMDEKGQVDTSYNHPNGEISFADLGDEYVTKKKMLEDAKGRLLCFTQSKKGVAIYRFTASGAVDDGFGNGGKIISKDLEVTPESFTDTSKGYVIAGWDGTEIVLVSVTENGAIDVAFGAGGVLRDIPDASAAGRSELALITFDGEPLIILLMEIFHDSMVTSCVCAFTEKGEIPGKFGMGGSVKFDHSYTMMSVDSNANKLYVIGDNRPNDEIFEGLVRRLDFNGRFDPDFNKGQALYFGSGKGTWGSMGVFGRGLAGMGYFTDEGGAPDALVVKYNEDGTLDTTFVPPDGFGSVSRAQYGFEPRVDNINGMVIQSDRMLICGRLWHDQFVWKPAVASISLAASEPLP
jgi:hypothetical protein